jgi:uncharacterized damage-inducible protein DinB
MWIHPELLAKHLEYSLWASLEILTAAEEHGATGDILDTLSHIYQADRVWFRRYSGDPYYAFSQPGDNFTFEQLRRDWPTILTPFAAAVREQTPEQLNEDLFWRNLKGEDKTAKRFKILLHIVNHGSYHRGQVITKLKQAGGRVVSTDLIYYPGM